MFTSMLVKVRQNLNLIYACVSTPKQKADLARCQIETLEAYC
jgi:predicted site-specific integrase-resolvase